MGDNDSQRQRHDASLGVVPPDFLIDTTLTPEQMTQPLPVDAQHVHFGKGQTETTVTLPPGKHTLQLVLANWSHIPFKPPVQSEVITITVAGAAAEKDAPADRIAKAGHRGAQPVLPHHLGDLGAGRRVAAGRIAQNDSGDRRG